MNSKSQQNWNDDRRKQEWKAGARTLRLLAEKMESDEIDKGAHWNIQLLLSEDLGKIVSYGKISDSKPNEEQTQPLTPFQRVAAHPKGSLAILRFLRGGLKGDEKEMELAMYEVTDIYDEVFHESAMMPRFMAEMLSGT